MTYTTVLLLAVAFVATTGFSLQDSQSYESMLSAISAMTDGATVQQQPGSVRALRPHLEQSAESTLSRVSRSAGRKCGKMPNCCGSAEGFEFPENFKAAYPECYPDTTEDGAEDGKCLNHSAVCASVQCIAKKEGVVDSKGYVIQAELLKKVDNSYAEESLKTLAKELAPDCIEKANAHAAATVDTPANVHQCNMAPMMVYGCLKHQVFVKCPEELQVKSEQCEEMRQRMDEWHSKKGTN